MQFATAVAADRDQRHVPAGFADVLMPQAPKQAVDDRRAGVDEAANVLAGEKALFQSLVGGLEFGASVSGRPGQG